jgi:16S rRNA (guanine527-N7)-methyltransferase
MLNETQVRGLLAPFGLRLSSEAISRILAYLELLCRWNAKISLTAIRSAGECVTRHFGESLYVSKLGELKGDLLDIGSGAGFPGLALKIVFPGLRVTLLEPVAKKRAFLKEVARVCGMNSVEVCPQRLAEYLKQNIETGRQSRFDAATSRAVGNLGQLIPQAAGCLTPGGSLCLWLGQDQAHEAATAGSGLIDWNQAIAIPLAERRQIWRGWRRV